jgi:DNA polymerase III subunit alpha
MSALLTSESGNSDKIVKYINECRDMGIRVLPPDVNHSDFNFTPSDEAIRFGLGAIKNVGQGAVEAVVAARAEGGEFSTIFDFCERVNLGSVNRRVMESLIKAGAMDSLKGNRAQLTDAIDRAMETGLRALRDREMGQAGLFGFTEEHKEQEYPLATLPQWTSQQKLAGEKELLGIYVSGHPLDQYGDKIGELATHTSDKLDDVQRGHVIALCGLLTGIQRKTNKENKHWAQTKFDDGRGSVDAMLFASRYEELLPYLKDDVAVLLKATVMREEDAPPKLNIQDITPLDDARVDLPTVISIRVWLKDDGDAKAQALNKLFERKQGATEVRLRLEKPRDFSVIIDVASKVRADREFRSALEEICGPDSMEVLAR